MRLRFLPVGKSLAFGLSALLVLGGVATGCGDDDDNNNNNTPEVCDDGVDNDGDGNIDCADQDCDGQATCEYGTEVTCDDGIDNDGDGDADCEDADCDGVGICEVGTEVTCDDGEDNDGDGDIDCADSDCADMEGCLVHFTLLQTSDLHNHATGYGAQLDYTPLDTADQDSVLGGFARLAAVIGRVQAENAAAGIPTLVVDSGDWHSGTLYDMTAADLITLKYFQVMGYTAITLGNHEFDWGPDGLAFMLQGAISSTSPGGAFQVPIVASNLVWDASSMGDDNLKALFDAGVIADRHVVELPSGVRIGLLGRVGPRADAAAPGAAPVTFDNDYASLQQKVDDLRNNDNVDLVVFLSHDGINALGNGGGDFDLATLVDGVDIIAGGHLHVATPSAFEVANSIIFSPGRYGESVCRLDVHYNPTAGTIQSYDFTLLPVDDTVTGDATMQMLVDGYTAQIDQAFFDAFGVRSASPIAEVEEDMLVENFVESGLGDLAADAVRTVASLIEAGNGRSPFQVAVVPMGVIRDPLIVGHTGMVSVADAYNVVPLGVGPDGITGYPLIEAYLTGPELKTVTEVSVSLAPSLNNEDIYLYFSGLRFDYDPNGPSLGKVSAVYLCDDPLPPSFGGSGDFYSMSCTNPIDIANDHTTLYKIVTDYYTMLSMGVASQYSIDIHPKDATGTPIDVANPAAILAHAIDTDTSNAQPDYLRPWQCMISFLPQFFVDQGGIPGLPEIPAALYGAGGLATGRAHDVTQ